MSAAVTLISHLNEKINFFRYIEGCEYYVLLTNKVILKVDGSNDNNDGTINLCEWSKI